MSQYRFASVPVLSGKCPLEPKSDCSTAEDWIGYQVYALLDDGDRAEELLLDGSRTERSKAYDRVLVDHDLRRAYLRLRRKLYGQLLECGAQNHPALKQFVSPIGTVIVDLMALIEAMADWMFREKRVPVKRERSVSIEISRNATTTDSFPCNDYAPIVIESSGSDGFTMLDDELPRLKVPRVQSPIPFLAEQPVQTHPFVAEQPVQTHPFVAEQPVQTPDPFLAVQTPDPFVADDSEPVPNETVPAQDIDAVRALCEKTKLGCAICAHPNHVALTCSAESMHLRPHIKLCCRYERKRKALVDLRDGSIRCLHHQLTGLCVKLTCTIASHRCSLCGRTGHPARLCVHNRRDVYQQWEAELAQRVDVLAANGLSDAKRRKLAAMSVTSADQVWRVRVLPRPTKVAEPRIPISAPFTRGVSSSGNWVGLGNQLDYRPPSVYDLETKFPRSLPTRSYALPNDGTETLFHIPKLLLDPRCRQVVRLSDVLRDVPADVQLRVVRVIQNAPMAEGTVEGQQFWRQHENSLHERARQIERDLIADPSSGYKPVHFRTPFVNDRERYQQADGDRAAGIHIFLHYPSNHRDPRVLTVHALATALLLKNGVLRPQHAHNTTAYNLYPIKSQVAAPSGPPRLFKLGQDRIARLVPRAIRELYEEDRLNFFRSVLSPETSAFPAENLPRCAIVLACGEENHKLVKKLVDGPVRSHSWHSRSLPLTEYEMALGDSAKLPVLREDMTLETVPIAGDKLFPYNTVLGIEHRNATHSRPVGRTNGVEIQFVLVWQSDSNSASSPALLFLLAPHPQKANLTITHAALGQSLDLATNCIVDLQHRRFTDDPRPARWQASENLFKRRLATAAKVSSNVRLFQRSNLPQPAQLVLVRTLLRYQRATKLPDGSRRLLSIPSLPRFVNAAVAYTEAEVPSPGSTESDRLHYLGQQNDFLARTEKLLCSRLGAVGGTKSKRPRTADTTASATKASRLASLSKSKLLSPRASDEPAVCLCGHLVSATLSKDETSLVVRQIRGSSTGPHPTGKTCWSGIPVDQSKWTTGGVKVQRAGKLVDPTNNDLAKWHQALSVYLINRSASSAVRGTSSSSNPSPLKHRGITTARAMLQSAQCVTVTCPWLKPQHSVSRSYVTQTERSNLLASLDTPLPQTAAEAEVGADNGGTLRDLAPPAWFTNQIVDTYARFVEAANNDVWFSPVHLWSEREELRPFSEMIVTERAKLLQQLDCGLILAVALIRSNHFVLCAITAREAMYYDPMGHSDDTGIMDRVERYIDTYNSQANRFRSDERRRRTLSGPIQPNSHDCGVFALQMARHLSESHRDGRVLTDRVLPFGANDGPGLREKMVLEYLFDRLLDW